MAKINNRIKAMQERAAALAQAAPSPSPSEAEQPETPDTAIASVSAHFGATLQQIVGQRTVQRIPITEIAPDLRAEMRQPRLLPIPDQLMEHGQPVPVYRELVAELISLGQSLRQHQIQPIVVYPGESAQFPLAHYLILVGQRRWTAASLVGLDTIDAIVVETPAVIDRIRIQYAENEDREEFSDMERTWTLQQMKQALGDSPWEDVEQKLQMSRARRQQLLRLSAFTPTQQEHIAQLRLQETQLRTLHTALRNGDLGPAQADAILFRLAQISAERAAASASASENSPVRRVGIDGPTIARLVARAQRSAHPAKVGSAAPSPRWPQPLRDQLIRTSQSVQRASGRVDQLNPEDAAALLDDVTSLVQQLSVLIAQDNTSGI